MERYVMLDLLKCIACYAVICLHAMPFENVTMFNAPIGQYLNFFIDTMSRFAVPFFFMVSGFMLVKKLAQASSAYEYFQKYFSKISLFYFGWSAFYFFYSYGSIAIGSFWQGGAFFSEFIPVYDAKNILKTLYQIFYSGGYLKFFHLWYLIALLWSVVLLYYFFQKKSISLLLGLSLLLHLIGLFGDSYQGIYKLPFRTRTALFFGLFYCTLGGWLAYYEAKARAIITKWGLSYIKGAIVFFAILQLVERAILIEFFQGSLNDNFFIMTMPLVLSLFLYALGTKNIRINEMRIKNLADKVVGIYVIHPIIMEFLVFLGKKVGFDANGIVYQVLFVPLVYLSSYYVYKYLLVIYHQWGIRVKAAMNG